MREIEVSTNEAGQRLNKLVMKYLDKAPSGFVYKMLRKKNIKLNGGRADGSELVKMGDRVQLYLSDETIESFISRKASSESTRRRGFSPDIVYRDDNIMIVNKPAGVLTQKADRNDYSLNDSVIDYMLDKGFITERQLRTFKPSVCNRLDRNTSGLVLCGVSLMGSQELSRIIRERRIDKYYCTIAEGVMTDKTRAAGYLLKDEKSNMVTVKSTVDEFRREFGDAAYEKVEAVFTPQRTNGGYTELEVLLITGKTHQIRAQLKALGHPVIGDTKYGSRDTCAHFRRSYGLRNQLLHCGRVSFGMVEGGLSYLSGKTFLAPVPDIYRQIEAGLF